MIKSKLLPLIAERLVNTPLLINPSKAAIIYGVLEGRIQIDPSSAEQPEGAIEPDASRFTGSRRRKQGGYSLARREGGVALIDIEGSLVNRGAWIGADSGLTSYEGIGAQIDAARTDDEITSVILDIDSGGGEASGMAGIAQKVRELAAVKPVVAVVNDVAASAAYGIASGATEIVISPTSTVGSIGVVMVHMDHSGELAQRGVKPTIFQQGARKVDGHPYGPISGDAMAALSKMMEIHYEQFLSTVSAGRGDRLTAEAARATEAGIFIGQQAVDAGLADRIGTFNEVLSELQSNAQTGETTERVMTDKTNKPEGLADTVAKADHDAAVNAARTEGASASATRINAILSSPEAEGRETTARAMALDPEMAAMSATSVIGILGKTPKAEPKAEPVPSTPTPAQRSGGGDPEMGPDDAPAPKAKDHGWGDVISERNKTL